MSRTLAERTTIREHVSQRGQRYTMTHIEPAEEAKPPPDLANLERLELEGRILRKWRRLDAPSKRRVLEILDTITDRDAAKIAAFASALADWPDPDASSG